MVRWRLAGLLGLASGWPRLAQAGQRLARPHSAWTAWRPRVALLAPLRDPCPPRAARQPAGLRTNFADFDWWARSIDYPALHGARPAPPH